MLLLDFDRKHKHFARGGGVRKRTTHRMPKTLTFYFEILLKIFWFLHEVLKSSCQQVVLSNITPSLLFLGTEYDMPWEWEMVCCVIADVKLELKMTCSTTIRATLFIIFWHIWCSCEGISPWFRKNSILDHLSK